MEIRVIGTGMLKQSIPQVFSQCDQVEKFKTGPEYIPQDMDLITKSVVEDVQVK